MCYAIVRTFAFFNILIGSSHTEYAVNQCRPALLYRLVNERNGHDIMHLL
jgi:hypothetical protein